MTRKAKTKRSTQVPGQLYGYSLQLTRAAAHLLRAHQGQSISVEYLDDVATSDSLNKIAEQDKSGLAHNPVSDHSIDLWKTLSNWIHAIRSGALKQDTKFILYVAQRYHGSVIDRINAVTNRVDASILVSKLREEFWGKPPTYSARSKLPVDLGEYVNNVLSASDDILAGLFTGIKLENGSGSPNDDLLPVLREKALGEEALENVLKHLLGWVKREIDKCIEKKIPAILKWEDFNNQLVAAARKFDRSNTFLNSTPAEVNPADVEAELRCRVYVRQLEAVNCEENELVQAVNDFLRSAVDRTTWSERGDVLEGSFHEFEEGLRRTWQSHKMRLDIEQKGAMEEERGRLLFAQCIGIQLRLQGMDVPAYFVPGSFHTLADSLQIGWHPRYREMTTKSSIVSEERGTSSHNIGIGNNLGSKV